MRRAAKRDGNEAEIVSALRAIGVDVMRLDRPVDLLCGQGESVFLLEVKQPEKVGRKDQPEQSEFIESWRALGRPVFLVTNVEEALAIFRGSNDRLPKQLSTRPAVRAGRKADAGTKGARVRQTGQTAGRNCRRAGDAP